jgi:hypothetical protein
MPLQYQPFVSLYTDPGIKEISQDLKTRYYENLKAKDALAKSLDEMVALSPDEETKNKIRSEVDTQLEEIAKTPDLENKGFQIYDAVKSFDKKYTQVKKQYDASMAELKELEKKKEEGKVEPEYYDLVKANWFKNYKGVQFDEKGRLVQGTTFKAPTYYNSVDINEKLLKQLGILSPEENKSDVESFELSPDGTSYIAKKGNSQTSISLDRVRDAYNAILQTPDIDRYINDKVDKRYSLMEGIDSKTNLLQEYNNSIEASNIEYQKEIEKNNQVLTGDLSYGDKTQLENRNKQLQEVINSNDLKKKTNLGFIQQLTEGKEGDSETHIKSLLKDSELSPYKQYGDAKAYNSQAYSTGIDQTYKNARMQEALDANKWLMDNPEFKAQGTVTAAQWGGIDTKAKKENIAMYQQTAKELQKVLDDEVAAIEEQKAKGVKPENIVRTLSPELIKSYESKIQGVKNSAQDVQNQIDSTINKFITEKEIKEILPSTVYTTLKTMYPNSTSKTQFLNKILDTFDNKGDQDFMEFSSKFVEMFGKDAYNQLMNSTVEIKSSNIVMGGSSIAGTSNVNQEVLSSGMGDFSNSILTKVNSFISDKIDPKYQEIKESPMFDYGAQTSVSKDAVEVRRLTTAMNKYFTDKPIGENLKITVQGPAGDDIGNTEFNDAGIAELTGKDLAGYTVKKFGYNPMVGERGMFQVELTKGGEQGSNIVASIDAQQLSGTEIDKAVNRPEVSIARLINKLNPRDVDSQPRVRTIRVYDSEGNIVKDRTIEVHVRTGETDKPEVALGYNINGKLQLDPFRPMDSDAIQKAFTVKHANGNPIYELLD